MLDVRCQMSRFNDPTDFNDIKDLTALTTPLITQKKVTESSYLLILTTENLNYLIALSLNTSESATTLNASLFSLLIGFLGCDLIVNGLIGLPFS